MFKNIIGQSFYQVFVVLTFLWSIQYYFDFASVDEELWYEATKKDTPNAWRPNLHHTVTVNVFMCMTIGNELNARKVHGERNVFKGLQRSPFFLIIWFTQIILQFVLIQVSETGIFF